METRLTYACRANGFRKFHNHLVTKRFVEDDDSGSAGGFAETLLENETYEFLHRILLNSKSLHNVLVVENWKYLYKN